MVNWFSAMHHDYQSTFAAEEVDQELEEGIYRKCLRTLDIIQMQEIMYTYLINITDWVHKHGSFEGYDT